MLTGQPDRKPIVGRSKYRVGVPAIHVPLVKILTAVKWTQGGF